MNRTRFWRLGVVAAATVLAGGAALAGAEQASANSYGGMNTNQLLQLCESHGSQYWGMPGGGTIEIPTEQVQYGSSGDCVAYAQKLLVNVTYNISVDGSFGPQTQQAVLAFQRSQLSTPQCGPADGVVGPRTWMCLEIR